MLGAFVHKLRLMYEGLSRKRYPLPSILVSGESLIVRRKEQVLINLPLPVVTNIVAFKKDMWTTDLICFELRFPTNEGNRAFVIHEEMPGFQDAVKLMERLLDGFDKEWYRKLAKPAFAPNTVVIYSKGSTHDSGRN